jgi:1-aminocyclopropane-1-carboxylate synthase 1/2/6
MLISGRAKKLLSSPSPILVAHNRCASDPFSSKNMKGYINLGTAENYLVWDLLEPKLKKCREIRESDTHYNPNYGLPDFLGEMAAFLSRTFKTPFTANHFVIANGATAILDMISYTLCEPGDGIIVPTPFYPGFRVDLSGRAEATILPAHTMSQESFELKREALEGALNAGRQKGIITKALLISNPSNPMGTILSDKEIKTALDFCEAHNIHCIFDEIYGNSVHSGEGFVSAFALPASSAHRQRLHLVYGMSKDFTIAGFRIGVYYSENEQVLSAMKSLATFNNVSVDTQRAMTHFLSDATWIDEFLKTNQGRLRRAYERIKNPIEKKTPIRVWPATAGIFAWADLRPALTAKTFEAETLLYERLLAEARINMLPGRAFQAAEPGWFRICYAHDDVTLDTAAARLSSLF